jgi:hypothetical protein
VLADLTVSWQRPRAAAVASTVPLACCRVAAAA